MDLAIGQDQEHVVNLVLDARLHVLDHLLKDVGEEGRASELNGGELLSVLSEDAFDSNDLRVLRVSIKRETMADVHASHELGNGAEAIHGVASVAVIRLEDATDRAESVLVLVLCAQIVKGVREGEVLIGSGEIDSCLHGDAPA